MRGHTLPEALICAVLFTAVITIGYSSLSLVTRARQGNEARVEPRIAARSALDFLTMQIRHACHFYEDGVDFAGYSYNSLPAPGEDGPELLFAVPAMAPSGPGAALQYRVVGVHTRPRDPGDGLNPDAHQLVINISRPVLPGVTGSPATIDMDDADNRDLGERVFDVYTDATGFNALRGQTDNRITLLIRTRRQVPHGPVVSEALHTSALARNL